MKKFILILDMILLSAFAFAQNTTIKGVVRDTKGEPVIGAAVTIEAAPTVGTVTDIDGKYSLSIPTSKNIRLLVKCLSYKEQKVEVAGRTVIDIVLVDDSEQLEEVVVVGYGSMRRSDLTGSVTSLKINDDEAVRATSLDQMLQGHAAGVNVINNSSAPDAGVNITIRGTNSLNSDTQPLYVVDGVIINGGSQTTELLSRGTDSNESDQESNGLMGINPQDIASVEILKDASATAIFGSEGANGVVLITTKTANRDKPTVSFNAGVNIGFRTKRLPTLQFDEYVDFMKEVGGSTSLIYDSDGNLKATPVDWQEYSTRTAITRRYYASVSGRPGKLTYFLSLGYNGNEGLLKTTGYETYTGRLNAEYRINNKLSLGVKTNFSYTHTNMTQATAQQQSTASSFTRSIIAYRPYIVNRYLDPELAEFDVDDVTGPDKWISDFVETKDRYRIIPNAYFQWKINKALNFKINAGGEYYVTSSDRFKSIRLSSQTGTTASRAKSLSGRYNADATLALDKPFTGGHRLSGTLGFSMSRRFTNTESVMGWDIDQYKAKMDALNSALSTQATYSETTSSLMSGFVRAIYNYKDRYVLTGTFRADGSSRFQGRNKWGFFPSFAFAWRLSQEPWFNVPVISMAKLRLGWGRVGNQNISNYKTTVNYSSGFVSFHGNEPAYTQFALWRNNIPNPDLKWETTEQSNIGLDVNLFKGRVSLTAEGYYKNTYDLLKNMTIAKSNGFGSIAMNTGSITNTGFEFSIDAVPVKLSNGLEWNIGGNISLNRNKITSIGQGKSSGVIRLADGSEFTTCYYNGDNLSSSAVPLNIFAEGLPVGVFYGYEFDGIVQNGEVGPGFSQGETRTPGHIKYKDINGNGWIDEGDKKIIGNPNPDFIYGFNTSVSFKGLTLSAVFNGSYGNDIYNMNHIMDYDVSTKSNNVFEAAYRNAWRPDRQNNEWPGIGMVETTDKSELHCSRLVEDGSYLRLSNLSLSWQVPLKKNVRKVLKGLNLSASVQNVFVLTKYSGWDPEVSSFGTNLNKMGVDSNSYPQMRSIVFDIKFRF